MNYLISEDELWVLIGEAEFRDRKDKAIEIKAKQPVKFLNRQEVEKIFEFMWHNYDKSFKDELVTAICNLAMSEIHYLDNDDISKALCRVRLVDGKLTGVNEAFQLLSNLVLPKIDRDKITAILVGKILESNKDAVLIADEIIESIGGK